MHALNKLAGPRPVEEKTYACRHCKEKLDSLKQLRRHQKEDCDELRRRKTKTDRRLRGEGSF